MVELSTVLNIINSLIGILPILMNAATGLLSVILTGLLVYFYRDMRDSQSKQTDLEEKQIDIQEKQIEIQEKQVEIQESQTELENKQTDLIRGQNRPYLSLENYSVSDECFVLNMRNEGNGKIKRFDVINSIYIRVDDAYDIGEVSNQENITAALQEDETVVRISDVNFDNIKTGSFKSVGRPEKDTTEVVSIPPDNQVYQCFAQTRYTLTIDGEYNEFTTSEVLDALEKLELTDVWFQWVIEYTDLSGFSYYEFLTSCLADVNSANSLEDVVENSTYDTIMDEKVITPDYYQYRGENFGS